ncbi:MAG TPA: hypothetical protein GXX40_06050 [Firmicutes bacterium]|nr:hypothetical protein [Bacillota bacterium]
MEAGLRLPHFSIDPSRFLTEAEICLLLEKAVLAGKGFSMVRIGDGENAVLAQGILLSIEEIRQVPWRSSPAYCGIALPDFQARDELAEAVSRADLVGVLFQRECEAWAPMTEKLFDAWQIRPKRLCYAFVNRTLPSHPAFARLLLNRDVLLVGNAMPRLAPLLERELSCHVVDVIGISRFTEIPRILERAEDADFQIALISAGANAVILAEKLARFKNAVAIDFGHAADWLINGEIKLARPGTGAEKDWSRRR